MLISSLALLLTSILASSQRYALQDLSLNYPLGNALRSGNLDEAERLLSAGTPADFLVDHRRTGLHFAIELGSLEMVKLLLEHGANPSIVLSPETYSPLRDAVDFDFLKEEGCLNIIETLLAYGAHPNEANPQRSATAFAIISMNIPLVKLLVDHGADINQPYYRGRNLLECTIEDSRGNEDLITFLVARGGKVRTGFAATSNDARRKLAFAQQEQAIMQHQGNFWALYA